MLPSALVAGVGLILTGRVTAQTFTTLHSFTTLNHNTNSDEANRWAGSILSGNTLYGTAYQGGSSGNGTVFAVNTDGTAFTTLHGFSATVVDPSSGYPTNSDGAFPQAGLILSDNTLYGTASQGGGSGYGTVFSLSLPPPLPPLTIVRSGADVILMWPTDAAGFTLQSATAIPSTFTNIPGAMSPYTNPLSTDAQFYRLRLP